MLKKQNHGNTALLKLDNSGNSDEFKDAITDRQYYNFASSSSSFQANQHLCHECTKSDLRAKVKSNLAYNEYKQILKSHSHEKYAIIMLILIIVTLYWFKNLNTNTNGNGNGCSANMGTGKTTILKKFNK